GKKAVETAKDILDKKTVDKSVILPSNLVTKDNASTIKTRD
ncbi:MAG: D-ribose ABC transporter substrate-binding protein, partial [Firmicutes bacterium]|nr:D-ribose ABC transporter substrate-binding protein [Bacillota bacterium]